MPAPDAARLDEAMEARVRCMMRVVEMGRLARDRRGINLKTPVRSDTVVHADAALLAGLAGLREYVVEELNALDLAVTSDEASWATLRAEPNMAALGKRLGKDLKAASAEIRAMPHAAVAAFLAAGEVRLAGGALLGAADLVVVREVQPAVAAKFEVVVESGLLLALDFVQDDETRALGCAREAANRVQKLRKAAGLQVSDVVNVFYEVRAASAAAQAAAAAAEAEDEDAQVAASAAAPAAASVDAEQQAQWVSSALVRSSSTCSSIRRECDQSSSSQCAIT